MRKVLILFLSLGVTVLYSQESRRGIYFSQYEIKLTSVGLSSACLTIKADDSTKEFYLQIFMTQGSKLKIEVAGKYFEKNINGESLSKARRSFSEAISEAIIERNSWMSQDAETLAKEIVKKLNSHPLNQKSDKFLWEKTTKQNKLPMFL